MRGSQPLDSLQRDETSQIYYMRCSNFIHVLWSSNTYEHSAARGGIHMHICIAPRPDRPSREAAAITYRSSHMSNFGRKTRAGRTGDKPHTEQAKLRNTKGM